METPALAPCAGTVREVVLQNARLAPGRRSCASIRRPRPSPMPRRSACASPARPPCRSPVAAPPREPGPCWRHPGVRPGNGAPELGRRRPCWASCATWCSARTRRRRRPRVVDDYRHLLDRLPSVSRPLWPPRTRCWHLRRRGIALPHQPAGDDANEASALSSGQYFLTYLRCWTPRRGPAAPFVAQLQRALCTTLRQSRRHAGTAVRLLWLYKAHQRSDLQVAAIMAILERRLRRANDSAGAQTGVPRVLDRLVRPRTASTLPGRPGPRRALSLLRAAAARRASPGDLRRHGSALDGSDASPAMPRAEHDERIRALVECPVPLAISSPATSRTPPGAAPGDAGVLHAPLLPHPVPRAVNPTSRSRSLAIAEYDFEGRRVRLVATHATWGGLARVFEDLLSYLAAASAPGRW